MAFVWGVAGREFSADGRRRGAAMAAGVGSSGMADSLVRWGWISGGGHGTLFNGAFGGTRVGETPMRNEGDARVFGWRHGRAEVTLERGGNAWCITCTAPSRLIGPRHVTYEARHKRAKMAAWDFMARVTHACKDDEEGVRVGREAALWMRASGFQDETDD